MREVIGHTVPRQATFIGPYGVGKSTAVGVASDIPVVRTEVVSAPGMRAGRQSAKRTTTVGVDYGEWLDGDDPVALVGTPGQRRFRAVNRAVARHTTAYLLLVFGDRDHAVDEAREWFDYFGGARIARRTAVGVTRHGGAHPPLTAYRHAFAEEYGVEMPVLAIDPRERGDVEHLLWLGLDHAGRSFPASTAFAGAVR